MAHVGIAVENAAAALPFYRDVLGMRVVHEEDVPSQGVRVVFLAAAGEARGSAEAEVELLEPLGAESPVHSFLDRRGPGLHHVAFEVDDLAGTLKRLAAAGVRLVDSAPRPGSRGHLVAFLHPEAAGGVLVELVGPPERREAMDLR